MAAKSLVLVYERPENLECSLGSALGLQGDASNPVWALSWGGRVSSLGGFCSSQSVCGVKLFKEISSSKERW